MLSLAPACSREAVKFFREREHVVLRESMPPQADGQDCPSYVGSSLPMSTHDPLAWIDTALNDLERRNFAVVTRFVAVRSRRVL